MHIQRKSRLIVAGLLASVAMAGCAPRVFADTSGLAIVGSAPPPVEAPPPEPQKRVEIRENKIVINEKVQFLVNSDKILAASDSLLEEVAKTIKDHPEIKKIEIEGHASIEGGDAHNQRLSERRAKSVMKHLTKKGGVTAKILSSKGYGSTRPIADNESEDGREKNRRVEFTITEQDVSPTKVEVDDKGNEKVISEG